MKLCSCHIENFGGLSQFDLDFQAGLTTIRADNGFGKTTLAVFLRTMFYGFPRAGKTLDKNDRKKYLPWQGGKFGGTLTFSHEGVTYRIERTFGATPRQDTFTLYELDPLRKSSRFSENIGQELFGLDLDSFERSTYLPQNRTFSSLTTDSIQAKLGDLVEDANDVGSFEKAMQTLRSKRSTYVPYRGSGGLVNETVGAISQLQTELDEAALRRTELERVQAEAEDLQAACTQAQTDLTAVREQITSASQAAARKTLQQQYTALQTQLEECALQEAALRRRYPDGLPDDAALQEMSGLLDQAAVLQGSAAASAAVQQAEARIQRESGRFAAGLPTEADFAAQEARCRKALSLRGALQQSGFAEAESLAQLEALFAPGVPDLETLDRWEADLTEQARLRAQLEATALSPEEAAQQRQLSAFFAAGIPDDAMLHLRTADLARLESLRQETAQLEAQAAAEAPAPKPRTALPLLAVGLLCLLAGIGLLAVPLYLPGILAAGCGAVLLIAGIYAQLRRTITAELRQDSGLSVRLDANRQTLTRMTADLESFLHRYPVSDRDPQAALDEIRRLAAAARSVQQRTAAVAPRQTAIQAQIDAVTDRLQTALRPYRQDPRHLSDFRAKREQLLRLRQQKAESDAQTDGLRREIADLEDAVAAFLRPYTPLDRPVSDLLSELRRDCDAYRQAEACLRDWDTLQQTRQAEQAALLTQIQTFFASCGLETADRDTLQQLRDDRAALLALQTRRAALAAQIAQFQAEQGDLLQATEPASDDLDTLKDEELQLRNDLNRLSRTLAETRQQQRQLRRSVDEIPAKADALAQRQAEKRQYLQNSALLDTTMELLQQAREQLSARYMAPVQQRFTTYLHQLWGTDPGKLLLDTDWNVRLERSGAARELGYFSAGSADLVLLCMRFSLVDALFRDARPFLILDDPFLNLDDRRTEAALHLLDQLAERYQILYLTCHSSRAGS